MQNSQFSSSGEDTRTNDRTRSPLEKRVKSTKNLQLQEKENAIAHLETIRQDIRSEIKDRIKQRDSYSIQLTITLAALVAISFSPNNFTRALLAAPLISIYFTVLILYSYRIHGLLSQYLREEIEPKLADLCGTDREAEWESYYTVHAIPGIRRSFFLGTLWAVLIISFLYLGVTQRSDTEFLLGVLLPATCIYLIVAIAVTKTFWSK